MQTVKEIDRALDANEAQKIFLTAKKRKLEVFYAQGPAQTDVFKKFKVKTSNQKTPTNTIDCYFKKIEVKKDIPLQVNVINGRKLIILFFKGK